MYERINECNKNFEMYNLMAKTIARNSRELGNTLRIKNSPYRAKQLKNQPNVIYVKDNRD